MSSFSVFDRLVRYSNYLKVHRLDTFERLRPAVALTQTELDNFLSDPRLANKARDLPIFFYGLYIYVA